tara:strand:+ start:838 stop:2130 length:1293 start_codon:yes stop_codon:yes gene_type:complete
MSQTEVQLIKDAVIVNADVSNSAAIDVSKLSGVLPLAGGTITGDVTFDGETAGRDIVFDRSDNALEFLDDAKATFGTGADTTFTHSGADFAITNTTGNLNILNNSADAVQIRHGSETMIKAISDGAVELYHDNSKKAETTSLGWSVEGVTFSNGLDMDDDHKILLGTSDDLEIYHESSSNNSFIKNGTGNFEILCDEFRVRNNSASKAYIQSSNNGEVQLYFNNSKKFETTNTGIKVTGIPEFREDSTTTDFSNLSLPSSSSGLSVQNISATTGNFSCLSVVANNANAVSQSASFIAKSHASGNAPEIHITQRDGNNSQRTNILVTNPGAVELNYAGSKKFETVSGGATITGVCTATSFSGSGANLTDVDAGATGGGSDKIFYENGQTVTTNYTIGDTFGAACNAMAAGPITINSGVTVTVNSGETLTIV